jgi:dolichyl-diphosphooligosaccharide--protein glycosyltransferase/undecaprenyl-diphosphooligosaccharide--protein glycosyltransferase
VIADRITQDQRVKYALVGLATAAMLYPNITHVIGYKVPTVFNKAEVNDLVKLDEISDPKDYTLTWWDYGYPIWFYSNTNTLIDGGKHGHDNYLISKIMQTTSPELVANLSRLAVETYVDSNYSVVSDTIFKNGKKDQRDPNNVLSELENGTYDLPKKTRDVYLYFPYRMLNIFPTVAVFGNLDLSTGKAERRMAFYPTSAASNKDGILTLRNGIVFDAKKGVILLGQQQKKVKNFIVTQITKDGKTQLQSQLYHADGEYAIIYMQSYGQFIVMDTQTFNSTYVQMFILGKYNKELFELVVSSPYSKIYKLKI